MSEKESQIQADDMQDDGSKTEDVVKEKSTVPVLAILVVISLLLAVAATAAVAIAWFKNDQQQLQQSQVVSSLNTKIEALQQGQQVNKNILAATQASLNKQQQEIAKQLSQITEKLGRNRHDWAVSEIRYTLRQANMRLQLFKDKTTALVALQIADTQLEKLADPALYKVRAAVNKELAALRAAKEIDLEGTSLKLTALAEQVKNLEVSITERSKTSNPQHLPEVTSTSDVLEWQKHADAVWNELKTLVTIRRTDKKILPLLSQQESQQLRQALGLKIEIARLALLQQNTSLFHASLQAAKDWLEEYFNADQTAVQAITKQLSTLMNLQLEPNYPDISRSLATLEQLQGGEPDATKVIKKDIKQKIKKVVKPKQKKSPVNKEKPAQ